MKSVQELFERNHVNKDSTSDIVLPKVINDISGWKDKPELEFFVDFETVTDVNDDFSNFPYRSGNSLIL